MKNRYIIVLGFVLNCFIGFSQSAAIQRKMYNLSIQAYEKKDYKEFLRITKSLDSLRPLYPTYTYNLASSNALNGNYEEALIALRNLVLMDNTTEFEKDEDFKSMLQDSGFRSVLDLRTAQGRVVETSKPVVTLSEKELHPEGLAYLSKSKTWLASSIRKRKIVAFNVKTGECTDWLTDGKMLSVLAMKADAKEEFLWIATAAFPEMEQFEKSLIGISEILKVDIKNRKIVKGFRIKGSHVFGDLVISKNGTVYVSDSNDKPMIYEIKDDVISEFISFEKEGYNLQGMVFNDTQDRLFVADYLKGIAVIDLKTKVKTWLGFPDETSPKGIDGLVFYRNSLIAIQNGVKPIRIMKFGLNTGQDKIIGFKVLDNNRPEFNEPALATIVGEKLYFFANSPWKAYDKNGVPDFTKFRNPMLFSCKLD